MRVELPPELLKPTGLNQVINQFLYEIPVIERLDRGIYWAGWAFGNHLRDIGILENEYPMIPLDVDFDELTRILRDGSIPSDYGVVDYPMQVVELFPIIDEDPRPFVISVHRVRKADCDPQGGWRWHKWGPYYGKHEPTTEYLYDEPLIEEVWTYHIHEVKLP